MLPSHLSPLFSPKATLLQIEWTTWAALRHSTRTPLWRVELTSSRTISIPTLLEFCPSRSIPPTVRLSFPALSPSFESEKVFFFQPPDSCLCSPVLLRVIISLMLTHHYHHPYIIGSPMTRMTRTGSCSPYHLRRHSLTMFRKCLLHSSLNLSCRNGTSLRTFKACILYHLCST